MSTIHPIGLTGLDALYFEMDQLEDQNRKAAREMRHAAEGLQIHALREQAEHVQEAALLAGLAQGVGGACSMAGAAAKGVAFGLQDTDGTEQSIAAARRTADGVAGAFEAAGQIAGGAFEAMSGAEDAAAMRRAAQATAAGSAATDAKGVEEDCEKAQDQIVRNLETAQQIQRDLMSALVRA
jgi:hypothetical protein